MIKGEPDGGGQRLLRVCRLYAFGFSNSFVAGDAALTAAVPHLIVRRTPGHIAGLIIIFSEGQRNVKSGGGGGRAGGKWGGRKTR